MSYKIRLLIEERYNKFGENGHWFVVRNGDYEQKLGDVLTRAVRYKPRKYPEDCHKTPEIVEEKQTSLTIRKIVCYGEELGTIGQGMTGLLALEGPDTEWLNEMWCFE